jgi:hypothetical protein
MTATSPTMMKGCAARRWAPQRQHYRVHDLNQDEHQEDLVEQGGGGAGHGPAGRVEEGGEPVQHQDRGQRDEHHPDGDRDEVLRVLKRPDRTGHSARAARLRGRLIGRIRHEVPFRPITCWLRVKLLDV